MKYHRIPIVIASIVIATIVVLLLLGSRLYVSVPAGHASVATLFGDVRPEPYEQGLHVPVNPLYDWHLYDVRQKSYKETANVPSPGPAPDQRRGERQYRLVQADTPRILQGTGTASDVLAVHLIPKLRSLLREQGKTIKRAEDFFLETTQDSLQTNILEGLRAYLRPKGVGGGGRC